MSVAPSAIDSIPRAECVTLTSDHVDGAFALSSIAGWNQTPGDWHLLFDISDACYGVRIDGQIVATATLVCYGRALGWIGMVLTHPDFRRRGLARELVGRVVEYARMTGIETLKLDATDDGRHLYESFGFQAEQTVERWQLMQYAGQAAAHSHTIDYALDAESCGYDRGWLLTRLGEARPGRLNRYLGPCVAKNQAAGRCMIEETIAHDPDTGWFWDLLPANEGAVAIARELGFERVRQLTRMTRGRELRGKEDQIFAIAGFELG